MNRKLSILPMMCFALCISACGNVVNVIEEDLEEDLQEMDQGQDISNDLPEMNVSKDMFDMTITDTPPDLPADMSEDMPADMMEDMPPDPTPAPVFYDDRQTLSSMTPFVLSQLSVIKDSMASPRNDVFIKVGDSNTVSTNFLHCFASNNINLNGQTQYNTTIEYFKRGQAGNTTPFDRVSQSATVGWSARSAINGSPSPMDQELSALNPRFALVQFGTNDIEGRNIFSYASQMTEIVETLISRGVIPILTSIAPRDDKASSDALVPFYNNVMRGLAQAHQIPFIDLHRELIKLPENGLGGDNLHLNAYGQGACDFSAEGLKYGQNMRNWLTLQTLHRLKTSLLDGAAAPDQTAPVIAGKGTNAEPYLVPSLPFTHAADTSMGQQSVFDRYDGCSANQNESGQEVVYALTLDRRTTIRLYVFDGTGVDIDLHLLDASLNTMGCLERNDKEIEQTLDAGTYYIVLDTFVSSSGKVNSGPYLFTVDEVQ